MGLGIKKINVHGLNLYQAKIKIDSEIRRATKDVYRLRIIHGYHSGTAIKEMLGEYEGFPKVLRIAPGGNDGETDLVLREL
ncbi:MAG: hypothetical protein RR219_07980 [Clostridiales bacterium]